MQNYLWACNVTFLYSVEENQPLTINENFINDEFLWFVIQWGFDEKCLIIRHSYNGIQVIFVYVRARLFFNSHPSYFQERITRMVC